MTLEQLRIFLAVAERQHVTQAARALNLTQSAVSSALAALETRHGVALFDRVGRGIRLNTAGQVFLDEARAVLARAAAAETALADLSGLARGRLSIHASQTIASYWLPPRLAAFHAAHPGIDLDIAIGNTAQVARAVAEGEAELGLVEGEVDDPVLERSLLDHDDLALIVAAAHPWAGLAAEPEDLTASAWVMREAGSGTRAALEAALKARGLGLADLTIAMTLPANEAVRTAVRAGAGAALLSRSVAVPGLAAGLLAEVPFAVAPRAFHRLRHRERRLSLAASAFLGLGGAP
ncbi:MAG: LysR family transcriptional regulator [Proteobacteria bacterium]|nr:LysR family transcriptional regulator [Pseudomonadota bacterium]